MDLRKVYAIIGCIYLGMLLVCASSESHEKFDAISPSDDQLLLIRSVTSTGSFLMHSARHFLEDNEVDTSGDSMPTTKQGRDIDPSAVLSTKQRINSYNSFNLTPKNQEETSKLSLTKQTDNLLLPQGSSPTNSQKHINESSLHKRHTDNLYLATHLPTRILSHKNKNENNNNSNASADLLLKPHSPDSNPSVTMVTSQRDDYTDPPAQSSTKRKRQNADLDPLAQVSTKHQALNDDPSTSESTKNLTESKSSISDTEPVTVLFTKPKADQLNDFTVKPSTVLTHDLQTTNPVTVKRKTDLPTSSIRGPVVPQNIRIMSATEKTLTLSLGPLSLGQRYMIKITSDQDSNFRHIFYTAKTKFTVSSLIPGILYRISVSIITESLQGEEFKLENYTVPVAPQLNISKIENNSINFVMKNGTSCKDVHVNEELRNHARIYKNAEVCKLELVGLCPGKKYSMSVWQTRDVWKSRSTEMTFATEQKRRFDYTVHGNILMIRWQELKQSGCNINAYKIYMNDSKNTLEQVSQKPEYSTLVRAGSTYIIRIQTIYKDGIGELSEAQIITISKKLPGMVQNFTILSLTATTAQIFLQLPTQRNEDILGYLITTTRDKFCQSQIINCTGCKRRDVTYALPEPCKKKLCSNYSMKEVEILNKEFTIEHLLPFHEYKMAVAAFNKEGCGTETTRFFKTLESIPTQVENLKITKVTNTSLEFQWDRPCFPNGNLTKYKVEYETESGLRVSYQTVNQAGKLEKLQPYKMYTIKVSACTRLGCSKSYSVKERTHVGTPINVKNVTVRPVSSTSVIVSWDQPEEKRGPTNYSVETFDNGKILPGCQAEGFQAKKCTVTGLDEYWPYTFNVTAYTTAGRSYPMQSKQIYTLESTPGRVTKLKIEFKCYTKILITWEAPGLRERNGIIHKYRVSLLEQHGLNKSQIVKESHRYQEFNVKPERNFTIQVRAITKIGEGRVTEETINIPAGPPVIPVGILFSQAPFLAKDRRKQIAILLPMKFFSNDSNGNPILWGLIVAQSEAVNGNNTPAQMARNTFHPKSMHRWQDVHSNDIIKPYRVTAEDWKPPSFYGDDGNSHYILGADEECGGGQSYCNGYLQPGRSYRVKAFMCTRGGCSVTRYSGLFYTEKDMSPVYISTPILLTIAVISLAAVYLIWRRQLFCFRKHPITILSEVSSIKRTGETNKSFIINLEPRSRSIMLNDFHEKVERMKKDSNLLFCEEFQLLRSSSPSKSHSAAELQANRTKNRYTNILAFDHSRVKLLPLDDEEGSDYINANYMPGYNSKREYIAAQGPLPGTKDDFWRMIWEKNVSVVVMVTQAVERGRVKCEIYWPTGTDPVYFGDLVVQLRSESNLSDYILKILDVQLGEEKREVKHFHFLKWPDFGCPANTSLLINFIQTVRSYMPYTPTGPTIIHCSAGVGRTGTFIAIDWLLQHIREHQEVDIFGLILEMRNYRVNMVQTEDQYIFIHQCIADHLRQVEGRSAEEDVFINDTQM